MFKDHILRASLALCVLVMGGCESRPQGKEDYALRARGYLNKGDTQKAFKYFEKAIKADPKKLSNYMTAGHVYLLMNNYHRAKYVFAAATRISPNNADAWYLLALSQAANEDSSAAIASAQKSLRIYQQKNNKEAIQKVLNLLDALIPVYDRQAFLTLYEYQVKGILKIAKANEEGLEFVISSQGWAFISDFKAKEAIVAQWINSYRQKGVEIKKPAAFYAAMLDKLVEENPDVLRKPFKEILKIMAAIVYDFDNGKDKQEVVREVLGK